MRPARSFVDQGYFDRLLTIHFMIFINIDHQIAMEQCNITLPTYGSIGLQTHTFHFTFSEHAYTSVNKLLATFHIKVTFKPKFPKMGQGKSHDRSLIFGLGRYDGHIGTRLFMVLSCSDSSKYVT